MNMRAADQAATALALIRLLLDLCLGERWRRWRLVSCVAPAQGLLVVQADLRIAGLGLGPCAVGLHEQRPVGSGVRKAFAELGRLAVDLADSLAEAERLGLKLDRRLVHQRLPVDGVAREADTFLQVTRERRMLDHDVSVVSGTRVHTRARRTGRACGWRAAARIDGAEYQGQCRAGRHEVLAHAVSSRRSAFPERAAESRPPGASVPLRADGSPFRAFRSPGSRIAAPIRLPEVLFTSVACLGRRLLAHSCATAPASHR